MENLFIPIHSFLNNFSKLTFEENQNTIRVVSYIQNFTILSLKIHEAKYGSNFLFLHKIRLIPTVPLILYKVLDLCLVYLTDNSIVINLNEYICTYHSQRAH